jgi:hypothetical protein
MPSIKYEYKDHLLMTKFRGPHMIAVLALASGDSENAY